jgi:hypothetical protein
LGILRKAIGEFLKQAMDDILKINSKKEYEDFASSL